MQKNVHEPPQERGRKKPKMDTWRDRLVEAIRRDGRSLRAISISAGLSENYLWVMLKKGKEPTIRPLQAICQVLGVSVSHVLEGIELSEESERLLRLFARMPEEQQEAFLTWLESQKAK